MHVEIIKRCYQCETEFIPKHANTLCCSAECKKARAYELNEVKRKQREAKGIRTYVPVDHKPKVCIICEEEFETTNGIKVCCSQECSDINNDNKYQDRLAKKRGDTEYERKKTGKKPRAKVGKISEKFLTRGTIRYEGLLL